MVTMMMRVEDVSDRLITYLANQLLNRGKILRKLVVD